MEKPSTSNLKFTPEMKAALDRFINSEEYQAKLSALREDFKKHKPYLLHLIAEAKASELKKQINTP